MWELSGSQEKRHPTFAGRLISLFVVLRIVAIRLLQWGRSEPETDTETETEQALHYSIRIDYVVKLQFLFS